MAAEDRCFEGREPLACRTCRSFARLSGSAAVARKEIVVAYKAHLPCLGS